MLEAFYAGNGTNSTEPSWVMEGVFGEYVQDAISKGKATAVLLLDTPFETCKVQVTQRGGNHGTTDTEESREKLFKYAAGYYSRDDARSEKGHRQILEDAKARGLQTAVLSTREEVGHFLHVAKTRIVDLGLHPPPSLRPILTEDGERGGEGEGEVDGRASKKGAGKEVLGGVHRQLAAEGITFAMRAVEGSLPPTKD
jgi:hypothetical protein